MFCMVHVFALACILHIFFSNLASCPYASVRIFRGYLGQVNRCKTTNLKTFYTKLLCPPRVSTRLLSICSSEQTSGPYWGHLLGMGSCLLQDVGLPKPTGLSWTQFSNSCSFSQPQPQRLSSCVAHLSRKHLIWDTQVYFWQGFKTSSVFIKHEKELHIQTK